MAQDEPRQARQRYGLGIFIRFKPNGGGQEKEEKEKKEKKRKWAQPKVETQVLIIQSTPSKSKSK